MPAAPDAVLVFADRVLAFDHVKGTVDLVAVVPTGGEAAGVAWLRDTGARVRALAVAAAGEEEVEEGEGEESEGGSSAGGDVSPEELGQAVQLLKAHQSSGLFLKPVDVALVPDYYRIVKEPMCLEDLERGVLAGRYGSLRAFAADLSLIWKNAATYNGPSNEITRMARELKDAFEEWQLGRKRTRSGAL